MIYYKKSTLLKNLKAFYKKAGFKLRLLQNILMFKLFSPKKKLQYCYSLDCSEIKNEESGLLKNAIRQFFLSTKVIAPHLRGFFRKKTKDQKLLQQSPVLCKIF